MKKHLWTVARFTSGLWSTGGKPTDPGYAQCEVFTVLATNREEAKRKAQSRRAYGRSKARLAAKDRKED